MHKLDSPYMPSSGAGLCTSECPFPLPNDEPQAVSGIVVSMAKDFQEIEALIDLRGVL